MLSWQPSKRWALSMAVCSCGIRQCFNIFSEVYWCTSNVRCKLRVERNSIRKVKILALVLKWLLILFPISKEIFSCASSEFSLDIFVYRASHVRNWWWHQQVRNDLWTCECQISYNSKMCSFLQLMSKDSMSAFGADLSGDQEQQVSGAEKETNWHFLLNKL